MTKRKAKPVKLTPKQRVLRKYPSAYAYRWAGNPPWVIYANDDRGMSLNMCDKTAAQAWANAARRIK